MKNVRWFAAPLTLTLTLTLAGCGEAPDQPPTTAMPTDGNALLSYVPADAPYLAGSLAPVPIGVIDSYLERGQPVLDALQSELSAARDRLQPAGDAAADAGSARSHEEAGHRLLAALLEELDGKLSRSGLESLGFSLQPNHVVYGVGPFPVFRVELKDPDAVGELLQRLQDKSGLTLPSHEFQGKPFWRLSQHDFGSVDGTQDDPDGGLYLAISDGHLAVGMFPVAAQDHYLPGFLGIEKPATSDAAERLASINRKYGYQPYMTGVLDLQKFADAFLEPGPVLAGLMFRADHGRQISDQCKTEIRGMIEAAPRMVLGTTEISANKLATQYRVETRPSLAQELLGLVSGIPAIPEISQAVVELALGVKVGALRDFARNKASAIAEMPYQCEHLQQLNDSAQQLLTQLDQPIPPLVNNFLGIRASLTSLPDSGSINPEEAEGLVALHVEKPEMFVGMAQMFLPDLAELDLTPGSDPVQVPERLLPAPGVVAFAAISREAIGVSLGAGQEAGLEAFIDRKGASDGTILVVDYDSAAYAHIRDHAANQVGADIQIEAQPASVSAIAEAAQEVYRSVAGRNLMRLKVDGDGIVIDNAMTFK